MHRLILLMVRPRPRHTSQHIETQFPIRFRVRELLDLESGEPIQLVDVADTDVVATEGFVAEGEGRVAPQEKGFEAGVEDPAVDAERGVEGGAHISYLPELAPDARFAEFGLVVV